MPFTPSFTHTLGPLELEVMRVLWAHDSAVSGTQIARAVNASRPANKQLAYRTIMTTAQRLRDKGMLISLHTVARGHDARYIAGIHRADFLSSSIQQIAGEAVTYNYWHVRFSYVFVWHNYCQPDI
jgi:predicted transcriptional regulator